MGKDEKIMQFIAEECATQNISLKDFIDRIESSMLRRGADLGKRKATSNISRWRTGQVTPEPSDYPYIADALGVTEDELRSGHRFTDKMILSPEEVEMQEQRKREMDAILNLIRMNKYFNLIISMILFSLGLFCINNSLWHNPFVALGSLGMLSAVMIHDNRSAPDRIQKPKEKFSLLSVVQKFFEDISDFRKICKMTSLIGSISTICFWIIVFVAFLPFIESVLYGGKMLVSSGLYIILGVFFLFRNKTKED